MKTELVFKLEKEPNGFNQIFSPNCKIKINKPEGLLYLNYEHRPERVIGYYENLRQDGEVFLADIKLFDNMKVIEHRFEYAIEGYIMKKNEQNEVESIEIKGVSALMYSES